MAEKTANRLRAIETMPLRADQELRGPHLPFDNLLETADAEAGILV
jgi:hypothetical protein